MIVGTTVACRPTIAFILSSATVVAGLFTSTLRLPSLGKEVTDVDVQIEALPTHGFWTGNSAGSVDDGRRGAQMTFHSRLAEAAEVANPRCSE
jgi:hypothetical protein